MMRTPMSIVQDHFLDYQTSFSNVDAVLDVIQTQLNQPSLGRSDFKTWKLTTNGTFFIKSFYRFLCDRGTRCNATPFIFKGQCPKKINAFLWLACDNKILTLNNLFTKGRNKLATATCILCHGDIV